MRGSVGLCSDRSDARKPGLALTRHASIRLQQRGIHRALAAVCFERQSRHLLRQHPLPPRQVDDQSVLALRFAPPNHRADGDNDEQNEGDKQKNQTRLQTLEHLNPSRLL